MYRILHTTHNDKDKNMKKQTFGEYIREVREAKNASDKTFSLRQVAGRIDVEPSYLSKVERGDEPNPSEQFIKKLSTELKIDENVALAMCGKVSLEAREIILKNPVIFVELLNTLKNCSDDSILRIVREVKDGTW